MQARKTQEKQWQVCGRRKEARQVNGEHQVHGGRNQRRVTDRSKQTSNTVSLQRPYSGDPAACPRGHRVHHSWKRRAPPPARVTEITRPGPATASFSGPFNERRNAYITLQTTFMPPRSSHPLTDPQPDRPISSHETDLRPIDRSPAQRPISSPETDLQSETDLQPRD